MPNSKTIIITKFKDFIKKKVEINIKVLEKYNDYRFRKYRWYSYINRKRTDDNMLNKIENKYSKEHKIIIGDWSIGKQMSNYRENFKNALVFITLMNLELHV